MPILHFTIKDVAVSWPNGYQHWWVNFIKHCFQIRNGAWPTKEQLDKELSKHNATIVHARGENCLKFKAEQDITVFLLRWS